MEIGGFWRRWRVPKKKRGWRFFPMLSSAGNTSNADYFALAEGLENPMINVFQKAGATVRHVWAQRCSTLPPIAASTLVTTDPWTSSGISST
ncbi:DUF899 family protein [Bradyrhizobium diazoefficiens]|nr:DUF899 family protein [Bradyrhizobium diazoefficiens]